LLTHDLDGPCGLVEADFEKFHEFNGKRFLPEAKMTNTNITYSTPQRKQ
jgi:hypothetical protein